jgi:hypothetical protein
MGEECGLLAACGANQRGNAPGGEIPQQPVNREKVEQGGRLIIHGEQGDTHDDPGVPEAPGNRFTFCRRD